MLQDIHKSTGERMRKCISSLQRDFATIRSGRVSVSILDNVKVDYYGTPTVLSQVGSVLAQDANTIVVTPWEKNMLRDIEKALQEANVGANPSSNGDSIKLFFPPMTGDQRKEIAKQVKTMGEKAKVSIRNVRQDSNNAIKRLEKDKAITSDDSKSGIDEIQRITDEHIKKIDSMVKSKEQEVLKV